MILQVVVDLKIFILFFIILIMMFSMIFNVIAPPKKPEYAKVGEVAGNLLATLRLSLGDFDFGALEETGPEGLSQRQHIIFWVCWIMVVLFSMLIFLNFIIAEVSNTYQTVKDSIVSLIQKERAQLINLAEDVYPESMKKKNKKLFPKFIIIRELEE
jgi:hypothetical protein